MAADHKDATARSVPPVLRHPLRLWALLAVFSVIASHSVLVAVGCNADAYQGVPGGSADLWWGVSWVIPEGVGPGASASLAGRLAGLLPAILAAYLVGLAALRVGIGPAMVPVAIASFAFSPVLVSAQLDPAGMGYLWATTAWLLLVALEPMPGAPEPRRTLRLALQALAAFLCFWWSQGAFAPALLLYAVLHVARRRRVSPALRWTFAFALVILFIPLVFLKDHLPLVGYGFQLHTGLSVPPPRGELLEQPAPLFIASLLACVGGDRAMPFLMANRFLPDLAVVWTGLSTLALMLLPVFCATHRRLALRVGGLLLLFSGIAVVMVAGMSQPSAPSLAQMLPAACGVSLLLAAFVSRGRPPQQSSGRWVVVAAVIPLLAYRSVGLQTATAARVVARAHASDPAFPFAAVATARESSRREGRPVPQPLRALIESHVEGRLDVLVERRLGLQVARELEETEGPAAALEWVEEWRLLRPGSAQLASWRVVLARRIHLLLAQHRVSEALVQIERDRAELPSPEYDWRAGEALVFAIEDGVGDAALTHKLLELAELLLRQAAASPSEAPVDARLALAMLRARQGRMVETIRIAEAVAKEFPGSARPHLLMARVYLSSGDSSEGLRKVKRARALDPDDPEGQLLEGRLLASQPSTARQGVDALLAVYRQHPDLPASRRELQRGLESAIPLLLQAASIDAAEKVLQAVARECPGRVEVLVAGAEVARKKGELAAARELYQQALAQRPEHERARNALAEMLRDEGYRLLLEGQRDAALPLFQAAVQLAPPGVDLTAVREIVRNASLPEQKTAAELERRLAAARKAFEEGEQRYRDDDLEGAARRFEQSLVHLPENPLAEVFLGRVRVEQGEPEAAEPLLRHALEVGPEMGLDIEYGYLLLVRSLVQQDKVAEAAEVAVEYGQRHVDGVYGEQIAALLKEP